VLSERPVDDHEEPNCAQVQQGDYGSLRVRVQENARGAIFVVRVGRNSGKEVCGGEFVVKKDKSVYSLVLPALLDGPRYPTREFWFAA
jgi:hypothetical protein